MKLRPLQEKLKTQGYTLVADIDGRLYTSQMRGIAPILDPMKDNRLYFQNAIVVDKVIGKATAMLLILSQVQYIYAYVISQKAKDILDRYHVSYDFQQEVPYIVNRNGDGMCPMEKTVDKMIDLEEAFVALQKKQEELKKGR